MSWTRAQVAAALCGHPVGRFAPVPLPDGPAPDPRELLPSLRAAIGDCRAVALSGGLDSATLLALAAERGPVTALILTLDRDEERAHADRMARATDARVVEIAPDALALAEAFPHAVRAMGTLAIHPLVAAKWLLWRAASEHGIHAALSGVGADEVLLGHPAALLPRDGLPAFEASAAEDEAIARDLLRPEHRPVARARPPADLRTSARRLAATALPELTLPAEIGTAGELEVRLPFLDNRVRRFAALPVEALLGDGIGKAVLREGTRGLLPDAIRLRPKRPRPLRPATGALAEARAAILSHVDRLDCVRPERVRVLLDRTDPAADRVAWRLCSAVLLACPDLRP